MIRSFDDKLTSDLFNGESSRKIKRLDSALVRATVRKLDMIAAAHILDDLRSPPGNRLEALRGDLQGFHSIRVNNQWRIIFRWDAGAAHDVQLIDYHR